MLTGQSDGYPVFLDDVFVAPPLVACDGTFMAHHHCIDAVLHGDNAHEGNVFRHTARKPNALALLKQVASEILGNEGCARLIDLYELSDDLDEEGLAWRLHQFPEDVRFYLHSNELQRVWPDSAFYHLSAPSPFNTSAWIGETFHTLDLLYVCHAFVIWLSQLMNRSLVTSMNSSSPRDSRHTYA
jgi:hypothetical protein